MAKEGEEATVVTPLLSMTLPTTASKSSTSSSVVKPPPKNFAKLPTNDENDDDHDHDDIVVNRSTNPKAVTITTSSKSQSPTGKDENVVKLKKRRHHNSKYGAVKSNDDDDDDDIDFKINPTNIHNNTTTTHRNNNHPTTHNNNNEENFQDNPRFTTPSDDDDRSTTVRQRMRILTALAATGGFLFGYDTGVISGATPSIARAFELTIEETEVVVSCTVLAAFVASLFGGSLNTNFGRRFTILVASAIFTIGATIMGCAWSYSSLVAGRIILGIAIGLASLTTPIYIAEVATPSMRGTLVTINGLLVCFGQFTAGMVDGIFDQIDPDSGWRYMLGLAGLPSAIMFVGFLFLPESPRWLVMVGREEEAFSVLESVRETKRESTHELQEIIEVCSLMKGSLSRANTLVVSEYGNHEDESPSDVVRQNAKTRGSESEEGEDSHDDDLEDGVASTQNSDEITNQDIEEEEVSGQWKDRILTFMEPMTNMCSHPPTVRALILGCGIMVLQQLSGINTVMYYAASIYEASGFDGRYKINLLILLHFPLIKLCHITY
jgi:hypothetical protein